MSPEERQPSVRLFVAFELPQDVRTALAAAMDTLKSAGIDRGLRWVRPEGIHVTLKFLGQTAESRLPGIIDGLREACAGVAPFELEPHGIGVFHGGKKAAVFRNWRESYPHNVRVVFVNVTGETGALGAFAKRIEDALAPLGFPAEPRPFFAHLTLGRVREDSDREAREEIARKLIPYLAAWSNETASLVPQILLMFPRFRVDRCSLMQSKLQPGGAVYTALRTFALDVK